MTGVSIRDEIHWQVLQECVLRTYMNKEPRPHEQRYDSLLHHVNKISLIRTSSESRR